MSKRERIYQALYQTKQFIEEKALNWSAAGIVRTDPITNEEAEFLEHQHQAEPQLEPIYITAQSAEGRHLKERLGVLLSHNQELERSTILYNSLVERGLTRHEFYEVAAILK